MARLVTVAGSVTGIPNVYQNLIDLAGGSVPGVLESGVVAIVGECEGVIEPKVPYPISNSGNLKALLGSGDLYDAARFAFDPSRESKQDVRGAAKVVAVRVNPALQSSIILKSSAPANLITLTSVRYGAKANEITATVATGSSGAPGKKLTIGMLGENDEEGDDLGFDPVFLIRYTGGGTASMTISHTSLSITGTSAVTASFTTYNTVQKLVAYLNSLTDYEAEVVTPKPSTYKCEDLDFVSGRDIKTSSASITITETATTLVMAGLAVGDVVKCEDEQMYVSAIPSDNTVVRGYNDTTAVAHPAKTAYRWYGACGVNQAMIEWVTNYSARCTAARHTDYPVDTPTTLSETYLSGGDEGTSGDTDWENAFKALKTYKYNYAVLCSSSETYQGYLKTHLDDKWGLLGQEALGYAGMATDATLSQIKVRAKTLKSENIILCFNDCNRPSDSGVDTNYEPWAVAAMAAGIQAGSAIGTPLTNKSLNVTALGENSKIDLDDRDTVEKLIKYGVLIARYDGDEYRILRALTTYTGSDDQHLIAPNNRTALAWTVYKVRYWLKFRHLGKKTLKGTAASMKSTARTVLEECRDIDESIVDGAELIGGRRVLIPAFSDIQVEQTGNVATVSYKCCPVDGTDFVLVNTTVVPFQDVA